MKVILANTYGFCPGVERAIKITKQARQKNGEITVWKEIIHNPLVITELTKKGIKFEKDLGKIKKGTVIFSAHGVPPVARRKAKKQGLTIIDATCPLVIKVHALVKSFAKKGFEIIYLGDKGHDEAVGVIGEAPGKIKVIWKKEEVASLKIKNPEKLVVVTQTTLSLFETQEIIELLQKKFPQILVYNTICSATTERQEAAVSLAKKVKVVIVVGGKNSANSRRLKEVAEKTGVRAYQIEEASQLEKIPLKGINLVGVTAGASTPDWVTEKVVATLRELN